MGSGSGWARATHEREGHPRLPTRPPPHLPTGVQSLIASRWESQQDSIASPQSEAWGRAEAWSREAGGREGHPRLPTRPPPHLPIGVQSLIAPRWESQQHSVASPQSEAWRRGGVSVWGRATHEREGHPRRHSLPTRSVTRGCAAG